MFRHPENEYDWQSSDAAVDEVLLINEYTFTEAGLRAADPSSLNYHSPIFCEDFIVSDTLSGTTHPDDNDDHPWWTTLHSDALFRRPSGAGG